MNLLSKSLHLLLIVLVLGCGNPSDFRPEVSMDPMETVADARMAAPIDQANTSNPDLNRKLIKEGWIEFETDNLASTRNNLMEAVTRYKGYISSDRTHSYENRKSNTLTIRTPGEFFDSLVNALPQDIPKFDRKEITTRDVTESFLDIQARLKTKKELENRYLALLSKATKVSEILEIEREIGQLRADIESFEGRLNYLQNQVTYATLEITFYEVGPVQLDFSGKFGKGIQKGWENLLHFLLLILQIWPFILGFGLGIMILIWLLKKNQTKP